MRAVARTPQFVPILLSIGTTIDSPQSLIAFGHMRIKVRAILVAILEVIGLSLNPNLKDFTSETKLGGGVQISNLGSLNTDRTFSAREAQTLGTNSTIADVFLPAQTSGEIMKHHLPHERKTFDRTITTGRGLLPQNVQPNNVGAPFLNGNIR
jgi:hypothetical protein